MDATDVAQDRNQLSAANRVVVDREVVLRELLLAAKAASHALKSYACGNASPELAKSTAEFLDTAIAIAEEGRT